MKVTLQIQKLFKIILFLFFSSNLFAQPFSYSIEAEDSNISGTHTIENVGRDNASGLAFLKLQTTGSASFSVNGVPSTGIYKLRIDAFNGGVTQDITLTINGIGQTITLQPSNFEFQDNAKFTYVDINLNAGTNTIIVTRLGVDILLDKFGVFENFNAYYISVSGNNSNDGLSPSTPWNNFDNVNSALANNNKGGYANPGDKFLFKSGETFIGELLVNRSGAVGSPIVISNYGPGALPILTGSDASIDDYVQPLKLTNTSNITLTNLAIQNDRLENNRYAAWQEENSYGILCVANKWGGITSNMVFRNLEITNVLSPKIPHYNDFNGFKVTGIYFESEENHDGSTNPMTPTLVGFDNVLIEDCYFSNTGKAGVQAVHKGDIDPVDWSVNRNSNFILRNNHFFRTGGSGIILSKMMNALVENNNFDQTGYDATPNNDDTSTPTSDYYADRLANRGSGMWVFRCKNVIAQYNRAYGAHGSNDSYGMHIDFGNEDIIYQYNYSEKNEGFVEILGENNRCTYRFNVSVNDGDRPTKGYTFWISLFAGTGNEVSSNNSYIYNNTVYLDENYTPDISIKGKNAYVYNNILIEDSASGIIGQTVDIDIDGGSTLYMSHNIYQGNVHNNLINGSSARWNNSNWFNLNPNFVTAGDTSEAGYDINSSSSAIDKGLSFPQPAFAAHGTGIFADIPEYPTQDNFRNTVDINNFPPNIGASNTHNSNSTVLGLDSVHQDFKLFTLFPNPVKNKINLNINKELTNSVIKVFDVMGKQVFVSKQTINKGIHNINLPNTIRNGIYFLKLSNENTSQIEQFILYR